MIKDVEPLLKECEETLTELLSVGNIEVACYVQGFINSINKLPEVEKNNTPKFEWICPCCGGKEYDANSLCLDCGARMISREVTENECKGN